LSDIVSRIDGARFCQAKYVSLTDTSRLHRFKGREHGGRRVRFLGFVVVVDVARGKADDMMAGRLAGTAWPASAPTTATHNTRASTRAPALCTPAAACNLAAVVGARLFSP